MKKTDLYKNAGLKVRNDMKNASIPNRFAQDANALQNRKAQRQQDQAQGLISFATKLPQDLVTRLQEHAKTQGMSVQDCVAQILQQALPA